MARTLTAAEAPAPAYLVPTRRPKAGGTVPASGALDDLAVHRADSLTRIGWVKQGLPARSLELLAQRMAMPKERLTSTLGLARATIDRKVRENKPLSADEGARVLGLSRLIGQVQAMVEESGRPTGFNAAEWLARWLEQPLPALGGQRPAELMDTSEGQTLVSGLLARMQTGAYA